MELKYSEDSLTDLDEILEFIAKDSPARAITFIEKIKTKIELLTVFPDLGVNCHNKGIPEDCRVMIFKAYLIFYIYDEEEIIVLSIINAAEDYTKEI